MTRIGTTMAMCGESGASFANLLVEQFQKAQDSVERMGNTRAPDQEHIWQEDY